MWYSGPKVRELKETGMTHQEATKKAGEIWNTMTEAQKLPFETRFQDDKVRYTTEMASYSGQSGDASEAPSTSTPSASSTSSKKSVAKKETAPAKTGSTSSAPSNGKSAPKSTPSSAPSKSTSTPSTAPTASKQTGGAAKKR